MDLRDAANELQLKVEKWRYDALGEIERALDRSLSSIKHVEDKATADKFASDFDELRAKVHDFDRDIDYMRDKVGELRSEAERKEREEAEAQKKKEQEAATKK